MTTHPNRRAVLRVGGAGLFGLGYPQLLEAASSSRAAQRATHPDNGGDRIDFESVQMARES